MLWKPFLLISNWGFKRISSRSYSRGLHARPLHALCLLFHALRFLFFASNQDPNPKHTSISVPPLSTLWLSLGGRTPRAGVRACTSLSLHREETARESRVPNPFDGLTGWVRGSWSSGPLSLFASLRKHRGWGHRAQRPLPTQSSDMIVIEDDDLEFQPSYSRTSSHLSSNRQ